MTRDGLPASYDDWRTTPPDPGPNWIDDEPCGGCGDEGGGYEVDDLPPRQRAGIGEKILCGECLARRDEDRQWDDADAWRDRMLDERARAEVE